MIKLIMLTVSLAIIGVGMLFLSVGAKIESDDKEYLRGVGIGTLLLCGMSVFTLMVVLVAQTC